MVYPADILIRSNAIFTALTPLPAPGYVAITGTRITACGTGDGACHLGAATSILELGDKLVCPGFADVHCFFTGYAFQQSGLDLSGRIKIETLLQTVCTYASGLNSSQHILAHGLSPDSGITTELLDQNFPDTPCVLFHQYDESCVMNSLALETYGFTGDTCGTESIWRLLQTLLQDRDNIFLLFRKYLKMLNSRGITSIKEMSFDASMAFSQLLEEYAQGENLPMRIHFMSQPVGMAMDLDHARQMRQQFTGDFVQFSGFNQMTDGSISCYEGDLKENYEGKPFRCAKSIDYQAIASDVRAADAAGFRFSLHAQGDAAISKCLDIFETCQRDSDGRLVHRHAITDLEYSDPADLERMGHLGVVAEIYPQIMSLYSRAEKLDLISERIGRQCGRHYWERRKMMDSGVIISCATDLPLLIDNIPESIYHACNGLFPDGGEPFNPENTLTMGELLKAWTWGGQFNLGRDMDLGTLEAGKLADIAVLDTNLFAANPDQVRNAKVCLTIVNGQVVYRA